MLGILEIADFQGCRGILAPIDDVGIHCVRRRCEVDVRFRGRGVDQETANQVFRGGVVRGQRGVNCALDDMTVNPELVVSTSAADSAMLAGRVT